MTTKKVIMRSDGLPEHLQTELHGMQSTLEKKYGIQAHYMGTTIENLAQVCAMVRAKDLTDEQREQAYDRSRDVCADVLKVMGRLLQVDRDAALAVAQAYREFGLRVEEELLGNDVLDDVKGDAAAVIAKAAAH